VIPYSDHETVAALLEGGRERSVLHG
jgi:hypothetical protein